MSSAVFYFSKSGVSEKVAKNIAERLKCPCTRLMDTKSWKGPLGFVKGGYYSTQEKLVTLHSISVQPMDYDNICIVSPVWASKMVPAVRTFIRLYKDSLKNVHIVFTLAGDNPSKAITNFLQEVPNAEPIAFKQKSVLNNSYLNDLYAFIENFSNLNDE